ncbi:MAG: hypothetical protein IPK60_20575 [Sandaracinaceae bacterium]|nr:hypothetical protein [Sandaracinaceae bacterium]
MSGRPRLLLEQIDLLVGDEDQKRRLKVIFSVLLGDLSVGEACERLSLGESRYYVLRQQVLEGALRSLSPQPAGRPRVVRETPDVAALRETQSELERELYQLRVREELFLALPRVLRERPMPSAVADEKGGSRAKRAAPVRGKRS